MKLTSTQIGAIAENLVANELMIESGGRLSPFQPIADDDGIDLLVYDKVTGNALPIQVKARTNTIKKSGKQERSNTAHFEVRKATFKDTRSAILLCVLLKPDLRSSERTWVMPLEQLATLTAEKELKFVIRANKTLGSKDKYSSFQCESMKHVAERLIQICESYT